jgi:hypothetical protein
MMIECDKRSSSTFRDSSWSRTETEMDREWMKKNPELAVRHLLNFYDECAQRDLLKITVDVSRAGFVTYIAVPLPGYER